MHMTSVVTVSESTDSRKPARSDERGDILAAAIKGFARRGYRGSLIPDIAAEAGIA